MDDIVLLVHRDPQRRRSTRNLRESVNVPTALNLGGEFYRDFASPL
jgi:hypothetical protein